VKSGSNWLAHQDLWRGRTSFTPTQNVYYRPIAVFSLTAGAIYCRRLFSSFLINLGHWPTYLQVSNHQRYQTVSAVHRSVDRETAQA
jgi:hypothetical protein